MRDNRYTVSVESFTVVKQIPDYYSGIGDRGNNVFVSVESIWLDPAGKPQYMNFSRQSVVYGDLFASIGDLKEPRRNKSSPLQRVVYAGKQGKGLMSGENIPCPPPQRGKTESTSDRIPMLLDETEFTTHSGMVYLPSIWSWSEDNDLLYSMWKDNLRNHLQKYSRNLFRVFENLRTKAESGSKISKQDYVLDSSELGIPSLRIESASGSMAGFKGDEARPIGIVRADDAIVFKPKAVIINSVSAQAWVSADYGHGRGVLALEYEDENYDPAKYVLYIRIESK